jgi:uncharacterized membrane protein
MSLGPVELLVVSFPGNRFTGEILPALKKLVEQGTIRIIDLVFVARDEAGELHARELTELEPDLMASWDPLVDDVLGILSTDDIQQLGQALEPNSSAGLMLFENTWATEFRDAVVNANGQLVMSERIPRAVIDELIAAAASDAESTAASA